MRKNKAISVDGAAFSRRSGVAAVISFRPLPPLEDGDLVFQTSTFDQFSAVLVATLHPFTHMGMIKKTASGIVVVEAAGRVGETPLAAWIARGLWGRIAVFRYGGLTNAQAQGVLTAAKAYYGKPYDWFFLPGDDALYCSELPYKVFPCCAGVPVGHMQKVATLYLNNPAVKQLLATRWKAYPPCEGVTEFEACYARILDQELVTPASIARDAHLTEIYSNYGLF